MKLKDAKGADILPMFTARRKEDKDYYTVTPGALEYWSTELREADDKDLDRIRLCQTMRMRILCQMRAKEPPEPDTDHLTEDLGGILTEIDNIPAEHPSSARRRA